jgi:hypothetical protein
LLSDGHDPGPRRQLLAALVLLVVLVAGSLWIIGALRGASAIQDCVQAGRSNCAPVDAPGR